MLNDVLEKLGFEATEAQVNGLNKFYEMLVEKNKVMNLTGITEYNEVVVKHFADSLLINKVRESCPGLDKILGGQAKVIDMGTGAGFPGMPMAIMYPNLKFTLMDSLNKRIKFLDEVATELGLSNVELVHARAEELARKSEHREAYDLAVSRAVAKTPTLSEYCLPFVKKGGLFIPYKSSNALEEVKDGKGAIKKLAGKLSDIVSLELIGADDTKRLFPVIEKINNIDKRFPRAGGKPDKEPLS